MNSYIMIDVIAWIVVYPLLLLAALLIYKRIYQWRLRRKREIERAETLARIAKDEERLRKELYGE